MVVLTDIFLQALSRKGRLSDHRIIAVLFQFQIQTSSFAPTKQPQLHVNIAKNLWEILI